MASLAEEPDVDGFVVTPAINAALDAGLEDIRHGRVVRPETVLQDLRDLSQKWRADQASMSGLIEDEA